MKRGIYLIWDLPSAQGVDPAVFFSSLGGRFPCAVQLRAKGAEQPPAVLPALLDACVAHGVPLIINDRADWLIDGVYGLHLGQDDGPFPERDDLRFGRSTRDGTMVRRAAADPAVDHMGFGPIYATGSKAGLPEARGFDRLAAAVAASGGKPVIAIGGLDLRGVVEARNRGASAAAVIGAVWKAADSAKACRELVEAWEAP